MTYHHNIIIPNSKTLLNIISVDMRDMTAGRYNWETDTTVKRDIVIENSIKLSK